jgi:glycosyltransferase involved in cell wall biosynthesis
VLHRRKKREVLSRRVLATCGSFEPGFRGGGPVRSLAHIMDTLPDDVDFELVTRDRDLGVTLPYPGLSGKTVKRGRAAVTYINASSPVSIARVLLELRRSRIDLLYVNSLWSPVFTIVPLIAARLGILHVTRVLLAPRGELSPGALALKNKKKRWFLRGYRLLLASLDLTWHASATREQDDIRALFPRARIIVNGAQSGLPHEPLAPVATNFDELRLIFLSRISRKKNLDLVLRALEGVSSRVRLDVFGTIEDDEYWNVCRTLARRLPASITFSYCGEVEPQKVRGTFVCYDAFIFPTMGENFGHVISESLSASCPVICSDQTPWTSVLNGGGGGVLSALSPDCLRREIERRASDTPEERLAARRAAGAAYRAWRATSDEVNVIGEMLGPAPEGGE